MESSNILIGIIVLIVFIILFCMIFNCNLCNRGITEHLTAVSTYDAPAFNAYTPLTYALDSRYVYDEDSGTYLLPYQYLNFADPRDLWAYYYYPSFYSSNYRSYWPYRQRT